jgi:hypothetical protein
MNEIPLPRLPSRRAIMISSMIMAIVLFASSSAQLLG